MKEFEAVVGVCSDEQAISSKAKKLAKDYQIENVLVTRGSLGMSLYPRSGPELCTCRCGRCFRCNWCWGYCLRGSRSYASSWAAYSRGGFNRQ